MTVSNRVLIMLTDLLRKTRAELRDPLATVG
jgi:hypothetical protein